MESLLDDTLLNQSLVRDVENLYLARYYYGILGETYTINGIAYTDREYTLATERVKNIYPNHELFQTTWSDDNLPQYLKERHNLKDVTVKSLSLPPHVIKYKEQYRDEIANYMKDLFNRSIKLIRDYDGIFRFISKNLDLGFNEYIISLKADGLNGSATYVDVDNSGFGILLDAHTRGRTGNSLDVTDKLIHSLPERIPMNGKKMIELSFEIILNPTDLEYFRIKYDKPFKTARNSIVTLLTNPMDVSDLEKLMCIVFKVKSDFKTLEHELKYAKDCGFRVTPYAVFTYSNFNMIYDIITQFEEIYYQVPYKSDGLVLALNNNEEFYSLGGDDEHFNGNIACKVGVWDALNYSTLVINLEWQYNTELITPVLVVEPTETDEGRTVRRIKAHNLLRILQLDICKGREVSFNLVSGCNIDLVYQGKD